jgi:hypothetical protein
MVQDVLYSPMRGYFRLGSEEATGRRARAEYRPYRVGRYTSGAFVIFCKGSPYNQNSSTYDARHSRVTADRFRSYIKQFVDSTDGPAPNASSSASAPQVYDSWSDYTTSVETEVGRFLLGSDSDEERLGELLAAADDYSAHHVIWVDSEGNVVLTAAPAAQLGHGLKFRFRLFARGNGYVGEGAASDEHWVRSLFTCIERHWKRGTTGLIDDFEGPQDMAIDAVSEDEQ